MSDWLKQSKRKIVFLSLVVVAALSWSYYLSLPDKALHLKIYDVGQGDAIFLETASGYKILVDGGPDNRVVEDLSKDLSFNEREIDLLILTHPEADHLTGLVEVAKRYQIKHLWISQVENNSRIYDDWQRVLKEKNIQPTIVYQGDKMLFPDKTEIKVLWPKEGNQSKELNDHSIVVEVSFGNFDAILTGDAGQNTQPYTSDSREIEVLKVPHHGAKTSLSETYLSTLSPEVSIISVGAKNPYHHPNEETINLLSKVGSKVFRTDQNGTVEIVSNGKSWYTKAEKN